MRRVVSLGVLLLGATSTARVWACDFLEPKYVEVPSGQPAGGVAPGAVSELSVEVRRGRDSEGGCGTDSNICDEIAFVRLSFREALDPDSVREDVGYRLDVVEGTPPFAFTQIERPIQSHRLRERGAIWLHWNDGSTDDQEAIDFTITLTPVDSDGNFGPTSEPIRVVSPDSSGCAVRALSGGYFPWSVALGVAGAALGVRRRRRSEACAR